MLGKIVDDGVIASNDGEIYKFSIDAFKNKDVLNRKLEFGDEVAFMLLNDKVSEVYFIGDVKSSKQSLKNAKFINKTQPKTQNPDKTSDISRSQSTQQNADISTSLDIKETFVVRNKNDFKGFFYTSGYWCGCAITVMVVILIFAFVEARI
ncbi:hypothetical protein [Campylobacter geochelonis]|uniref:hypothetical protein n=1 Tax=Campylobacter geochelonis TaxID=1780362 RepID=UPI0007708853|nr:hypothetical protein [Campylobacter geochelonis]CZE46323.1 Uncharacterised protein [Campylobacter geochelonis]CZE50681.1 Uncharacterised protein [Campylobacter geochelonis]